MVEEVMEMKKEQVEKHMVDNFGILHEADWDGNAHYEFKVDEARKWRVTFYDDYIHLVDNCGKIVGGHPDIYTGHHLRIHYPNILEAKNKDFMLSGAYSIFDEDVDIIGDKPLWLSSVLDKECKKQMRSVRFWLLKRCWWYLKAKIRNWLKR